MAAEACGVVLVAILWLVLILFPCRAWLARTVMGVTAAKIVFSALGFGFWVVARWVVLLMHARLTSSCMLAGMKFVGLLCLWICLGIICAGVGMLIAVFRAKYRMQAVGFAFFFVAFVVAMLQKHWTPFPGPSSGPNPSPGPGPGPIPGPPSPGPGSDLSLEVSSALEQLASFASVLVLVLIASLGGLIVTIEKLEKDSGVKVCTRAFYRESVWKGLWAMLSAIRLILVVLCSILVHTTSFFSLQYWSAPVGPEGDMESGPLVRAAN